jgi:hypothetical protein
VEQQNEKIGEKIKKFGKKFGKKIQQFAEARLTEKETEEIATNPTPELSNSDVLGWLKHENDLLNTRMNWLIGVNGLLLAVAGLKDASVGLCWIPIFTVGIAWTASTWHAIHVSLRILHYLNKKWRPVIMDSPPSVPLWVNESCWNRSRLFPWKIMPIVIIVAWVCIAVFHLISK